MSSSISRPKRLAGGGRSAQTLGRMNTNPIPLKLLGYSGREQGIMVVGSKEGLLQLAHELQANVEAASDSARKEWPPRIAVAEVILGPYANSRGWSMSFHIEGTVPAEEKLKLRRYGLHPALGVPILCFSLVGVVSIVRWLLTLL